MPEVRTLLVTGANGFVGRACTRYLRQKGYEVKAAVRNADSLKRLCSYDIRCLQVGEIGPSTMWNNILFGVNTIIHLAARVHVTRETFRDPLEEFRRINCWGTEHLARSAAKAGVQRFIFVSTIKVNGEETLDHPFNETLEVMPQDSYAISKWEAEQVLSSISAETGMELVIVRPPLIYGPGVKGNFLRLFNLVGQGIPLPLGSIRNLRSFISLNNFLDLLSKCIEHPAAAGEVFLVSDGQDLSTPTLIRKIAEALNRPARLLPFPEKLLHLVGLLMGKGDELRRLCGSLLVDSKKVGRVLEWSPPLSMNQELSFIAEWYRANFG